MLLALFQSVDNVAGIATAYERLGLYHYGPERVG